ncbi:VOC domain-containing protein [Balamuthia mandrillaris]
MQTITTSSPLRKPASSTCSTASATTFSPEVRKPSSGVACRRQQHRRQLARTATLAHRGENKPVAGGEEVLPLLSTNHASHLAKDIEATTRFYVDVLGFQATGRPESISVPGYWLVHPVAGFQFHLLSVPSVESKPEDTLRCLRYDHLCFGVPDLEAARRALEEQHGVTTFALDVDAMGVPQGRLTKLLIADPDANTIVLVQDPHNPSPRSHSSSPSSTSKRSVAASSSSSASSTSVQLTSFVYMAIAVAQLKPALMFYTDVLGFQVMGKDFGWLGLDVVQLCHPRIGMELHLIPRTPSDKDHHERFRSRPITALDDHISFYARSEQVSAIQAALHRKGVEFVSGFLAGTDVQQLFFHDPDGHMIEVCTCEEAEEKYQPTEEYKRAHEEGQSKLKERLQGTAICLRRSAYV